MFYLLLWTDLNGPVDFIDFIGGPQRTRIFYHIYLADLNGPVYFIDFIERTSKDLDDLLL
jgi:hypothetical protein